jgi:hypothetical protein
MLNNIEWNMPADALILQIKYHGGEKGTFRTKHYICPTNYSAAPG